MIRLTLTGDHSIVIPSVEDMIADRLGQHAIAAKTDTSRLEQALVLFKLARNLDLAYLRRRIKEEGGDVHLLSTDAYGEKGGGR